MSGYTDPANGRPVGAFYPERGLAATNPEPPPKPNASPAVWETVIEDMRARDNFGRAKYGTPLQPFNGRKPLVDAYQEALDLVVYLKQEILEHDMRKKPCCCGAMFALKALVEASSKRWNEERDQDGSFVDALGRAQALTGMPPFDWDKEIRR